MTTTAITPFNGDVNLWDAEETNQISTVEEPAEKPEGDFPYELKLPTLSGRDRLNHAVFATAYTGMGMVLAFSSKNMILDIDAEMGPKEKLSDALMGTGFLGISLVAMAIGTDTGIVAITGSRRLTPLTENIYRSAAYTLSSSLITFGAGAALIGGDSMRERTLFRGVGAAMGTVGVAMLTSTAYEDITGGKLLSNNVEHRDSRRVQVDSIGVGSNGVQLGGRF